MVSIPLSSPAQEDLDGPPLVTANAWAIADARTGKLLVAVLGSTSDTGRYVDTRNLFRWAWKELDGQ